MNFRKLLPPLAASMMTALATQAQAQIRLHTFQPGERARAADVNSNFNNLKLAIEAVERRNTELTNRIRDLEASLANVRALNSVLSMEQVNGVQTVRLTGVNLQVVNGLSRTETINGAGNLLIGYDEVNVFPIDPLCSRASARNAGLILNEADCLANGGAFSITHKSGSHNLVMGSQNNYSSFGGIVAGRFNSINQIYGSVLGGVDNVANGNFSVVISGQGHQSSGTASSVLGGNSNRSAGRDSTVTGGSGNIADGVSQTLPQ
jgi:hypothetical protein